MSSMAEPQSLQKLCQAKIISLLQECGFHGRTVNDLCKYAPDHLLDPIFTVLLEKGMITEIALLAYLVPSRISLRIVQAKNIRNSILKQIGMNCPNLLTLDLTDCTQVTNSVVRSILSGCPVLEDIRLNGCHKITDTAFDFSESPFQALYGCLSLQSISLQGCPQITGEIIRTLNKHCRKLNYLNLSQCKNVTSPCIQQVFYHRGLRSLNLDFIEDISDEAFLLLSPGLALPSPNVTWSGEASGLGSPVRTWTGKGTVVTQSPLQKLNLSNSRITDSSIHRMACLFALLELRLRWCNGVTEVGIVALTRNCLHLRLLDLTSCPSVTDHALLSIATCRELKSLDVSWCAGFSEEGLLQLLPVKFLDDGPLHEADNNHFCLEQLCLDWCLQITDRTVNALQSMESLTEVSVSGCSAVSVQAIESLRTFTKVVSS